MASYHHGLQHSLRFFSQRLQSQTRMVATNARRSGQNKKAVPSVRKLINKQPTSLKATERPIPLPLKADAPPTKHVLKYPEVLLIYEPSSLKTTTVAFIKMIALFSFAGGTVFFGIQIVADEEQSNWRVLNAAAWFVVPAILIHILTAPYVAHAYLHIPFHARQSLASLTRFASNLPSETLVTLTTVQFLPWKAMNHTLKFGDLHRLPMRTWRLANVEYRPTKLAQKEIDSLVTWQKIKRAVAGSQNKFFIPVSDLSMRNSQAPGVWKTIFEKIPVDPRSVPP